MLENWTKKRFERVEGVEFAKKKTIKQVGWNICSSLEQKGDNYGKK